MTAAELGRLTVCALLFVLVSGIVGSLVGRRLQRRLEDDEQQKGPRA